MSGHSKWANIKHKKAAKDSKKGKVFTRIAKEITISARDGGGDVDSNPRLRLAVQNGRAVNMPFENIKRAILKGTGELPGTSYEEITYEGFAPCGVSVIVETVTDNRNRTFAELRTAISKLGGNLGEPGSVSWNFDRKGVITIKSNGKNEDELLEIVLESGAEDLEFDDDESRVICAYEDLNICYKYFEDKKFDVTESKFEYLPKTLVEIDNLNDARRVMKFMDNIEDFEDSQNVFGNFDIPDSIMEQLENEN
jgi:YebC/PmpR family DNA-binding regulatory protein